METEASANKTDDLLQALGEDPTVSHEVEVPIPDELKARYLAWSSQGLPQAELEGLLYQYKSPDFLVVPRLNPEIILLLQESAKRRDEYFCQSQELVLKALLSLGGVFAVLLDDKLHINEDKSVRVAMTEMNTEVAKLLCHQFFEQVEARKASIIPNIKDEQMKALLRGQKTDHFLFGADLAEKITSLTKIKKVSSQLADKQTPQKLSGKSFLARRAAHPMTNNKSWNGQGQQAQRSTYRQKSFKPQMPNNNKQTVKRPQNTSQ